MRNLKSCIKEKIVIKEEIDSNRVSNLSKLADLRKKFWSQEHSSEYDFLVIEGLYEIIKELLTALINLDGFKSSNHECLIAFFNEKYPDYIYEAEVIDTLRRMRNAINYRGIYTDNNFLRKNKIEIEHIINLLQKLIREKIR